MQALSILILVFVYNPLWHVNALHDISSTSSKKNYQKNCLTLPPWSKHMGWEGMKRPNREFEPIVFVFTRITSALQAFCCVILLNFVLFGTGHKNENSPPTLLLSQIHNFQNTVGFWRIFAEVKYNLQIK